MAAKKASAGGCSGGCPGSQSHAIRSAPVQEAPVVHSEVRSRLMQWPIQLKLLPIQAPFYQGAKLLVAADCTAFSRADFHERFMRGRITMIGCPKLDEGDYTEKLTAIIKNNNIRSVKIARMEVPCCGGLENAVKRALQASGKFIPWQVITVSTDGKIID